MKACRKCGQVKPYEEFILDNRRLDGRGSYCRECSNARPRKSYRKLGTLPMEEWFDKLRNKWRSVISERTAKVCPHCKQEKPLNEYHNKKSSPNGKQNMCKACTLEERRSEVGRRWARATKRKHKEKIVKKGREIRKNMKTILINEAGGKCIDCGLECSDEWPFPCFDFHHLDSSRREVRLSRYMNRSSQKGRDELREKLKGTGLLCSNCHRRRHYRERRNGKWLTS